MQYLNDRDGAFDHQKNASSRTKILVDSVGDTGGQCFGTGKQKDDSNDVLESDRLAGAMYKLIRESLGGPYLPSFVPLLPSKTRSRGLVTFIVH